MNTEFVFRPIDRWPQKPTPPADRRSPFRAGWQDTMNLLRYELFQLEARNPVIMLALTEAEIRRDGLPRSDARPSHPGVIVSFDSKFGPLKLPCDACRNWRENVRAIGMHLEHLRKSALYGVGRFGEQYSGWKQLPGTNGHDKSMTSSEAATFIAAVAGTSPAYVAGNSEQFRSAYRAAAMKLHPDRNGGTAPPDWFKLQKAGEVLTAAFQ